MSTIDQLVANAQRYGSDRENGYHAAERNIKPAQKLAVVACMDSRLRLFSLLGLDEGDAHIVRNAGGVITDDVVRSLTVSQHLLETQDVMIIQHTDCGLLKSTDEDFDKLMREHAGRRPAWGLRAVTDIDASVAESVATVRESPWLINAGEVRGFVFDVHDGSLREVT